MASQNNSMFHLHPTRSQSSSLLPLLVVLAAAIVCYLVGSQDRSSQAPIEYLVRISGERLPSQDIEVGIIKTAGVRAGIEQVEIATSTSGQLEARALSPDSDEGVALVHNFANYVCNTIEEQELDTAQQRSQLYQINALLADLDHGPEGASQHRVQLLADRDRLLQGKRPVPMADIVRVSERPRVNRFATLPIAPLLLVVVLGPACCLLAWRPRPATICNEVQAAHSAGMPVEWVIVSPRRAA